MIACFSAEMEWIVQPKSAQQAAKSPCHCEPVTRSHWCGNPSLCRERRPRRSNPAGVQEESIIRNWQRRTAATICCRRFMAQGYLPQIMVIGKSRSWKCQVPDIIHE